MHLSIAALFTAGLALASAAPIPLEQNEQNDFFSFDNTTVTIEDTAKIPIKQIKCTTYELAPFDVIAAREKLAYWGLTHKVPGQSMKKARSNDVVWYVCNCKYNQEYKLAMDELVEAEDALFKQCGDWRSGWVWDQEWNKYYQIQARAWVQQLPTPYNWCPRKCAFDQVAVEVQDYETAANATLEASVNATEVNSTAGATVEPTVNLAFNATLNATES
ncbi:hypothetical protein F5B19DRAFT_462295 [Rostrohypoxylon terebratum]|nr:hypothetical protein F5B19DRAFT_462295 [Rostrohypoxylon terebratum]